MARMALIVPRHKPHRYHRQEPPPNPETGSNHGSENPEGSSGSSEGTNSDSGNGNSNGNGSGNGNFNTGSSYDFESLTHPLALLDTSSSSGSSSGSNGRLHPRREEEDGDSLGSSSAAPTSPLIGIRRHNGRQQHPQQQHCQQHCQQQPPPPHPEHRTKNCLRFLTPEKKKKSKPARKQGSPTTVVSHLDFIVEEGEDDDDGGGDAEEEYVPPGFPPGYTAVSGGGNNGGNDNDNDNSNDNDNDSMQGGDNRFEAETDTGVWMMEHDDDDGGGEKDRERGRDKDGGTPSREHGSFSRSKSKSIEDDDDEEDIFDSLEAVPADHPGIRKDGGEDSFASLRLEGEQGNDDDDGLSDFFGGSALGSAIEHVDESADGWYGHGHGPNTEPHDDHRGSEPTGRSEQEEKDREEDDRLASTMLNTSSILTSSTLLREHHQPHFFHGMPLGGSGGDAASPVRMRMPMPIPPGTDPRPRMAPEDERKGILLRYRYNQIHHIQSHLGNHQNSSGNNKSTTTNNNNKEHAPGSTKAIPGVPSEPPTGAEWEDAIWREEFHRICEDPPKVAKAATPGQKAVAEAERLSRDLEEATALVGTLEAELASARRRREDCLERLRPLPLEGESEPSSVFSSAASARRTEADSERSAIRRLHLGILANGVRPNEGARRLFLAHKEEAAHRARSFGGDETESTAASDAFEPAPGPERCGPSPPEWGSGASSQPGRIPPVRPSRRLSRNPMTDRIKRHFRARRKATLGTRGQGRGGGAEEAPPCETDKRTSVSVPSTSPGAIVAGSRREKNLEENRRAGGAFRRGKQDPPGAGEARRGGDRPCAATAAGNHFEYRTVEELRVVRGRLEQIRELFDRAGSDPERSSKQAAIETATSKYIWLRENRFV